MPLTHHDLALIQDSLQALRRHMYSGDTILYDRLFAAHPEMRAMFPEDITGQGMKLLATLETVLDGTTSSKVMDEDLVALAEGHAAMGVAPRDYAPLGDALIDTMHDLLGDAFTTDLRDAWQRAYADVAALMMNPIGRPLAR